MPDITGEVSQHILETGKRYKADQSFGSDKISVDKSLYVLIQIIHIMPEWKNQLILEEGNNYQDNYLECSFIRQSLSCVKDHLIKSEFNVAYDIVDMLHTFPGVILNGDKGGKERFKETYLKPLVRKWNLTLKL